MQEDQPIDMPPKSQEEYSHDQAPIVVQKSGILQFRENVSERRTFELVLQSRGNVSVCLSVIVTLRP
jgi:hypothetical protein